MFVYFYVNVLNVLFVELSKKVVWEFFCITFVRELFNVKIKTRTNNDLFEKCCFKNVWMAAYNDYDFKLCYQILTFISMDILKSDGFVNLR